MAELTDELITQLANEEVIDLKKGVDYHNRIVMTTESGYVITADIMNIQTPEERLAEVDRLIALKNEEIRAAFDERTVLVERIAAINSSESDTLPDPPEEVETPPEDESEVSPEEDEILPEEEFP
jgi:hypothetical protein